MKDLIVYIAKSLVDNPDQVEVKEIAGEKTLIYEMRVAQGDLGKIIGKEGRTAKAIRAIITAAAMKIGKRAQLEILE
ncbi:MAG TPA: KH domain-containing protein [candidate division WOR-3 bacterium]|uniref:RNA-binding protein KhpA n=1 Tax=candidate division WOR-3 bacterium TaxID=2052148 RepID=A0A7V0T7G6_UNCW3|nr:KH domain-containing protein [candidate division WOR-3 bacterium]